MLSLQIDGEWEPEDFIEVLSGVEALYYKALTFRDPPVELRLAHAWLESGAIFDGDNANFVAFMRTIAVGSERLRVRRISYASPGAVDLTGIGRAVEAVERVIGKLIELYTHRNLRREADNQAILTTRMKEIEVQKQEEELLAHKIANARLLLQMRRDYPIPTEEGFVALAVEDQDRLTRVISEGKLLGVSRKGSPDLTRGRIKRKP